MSALTRSSIGNDITWNHNGRTFTGRVIGFRSTAVLALTGVRRRHIRVRGREVEVIHGRAIHVVPFEAINETSIGRAD
jgi:hypothetical protein